MSSKLILILLTITCSAFAQDSELKLYEIDPLECFDAKSYWDCSKCECPLLKIPAMSYFNIVANILGMIVTMIVITSYLFIKQVRAKPGDLLCAVAAIDFVWALDMAIMDWKYISGQVVIPEFYTSETCVHLSEIYALTKYLRTTYTLSFFLYYLHSLKFSLKGSIPQFIYHITPIGVSAGFFYASASKGAFGFSLYGSCTTRTTDDILWGVIVLCVLVAVPVYALYYTHKYVPRNEKYSRASKQFLDYYKMYVLLASLISIGLIIIDIIQSKYAIDYWQARQEHQDTTVFDIVKICGAVLKASHALILSLIRLTDPLISRHLHKLLCCFRNSEDPADMEAPIRDRVVSMDIEFFQKNLEKSTIMNQIQHSLKVQVIYTILSALHYIWHHNSKNKVSPCILERKKFYQKEAKSKQIFNINEKTLYEEIPEVLNEIKEQKYVTVEGILTVYASSVFDDIIDLDNMRGVMGNSLDLKNNLSRILKAGINAGGKSGEFFFFSADNRLIIKTINDQEVATLLSMLPDYAEHLKNNPYSLLAKIYGVFTFEKFQPKEKYNLILMRNLNGYPSSCIERKYDLKGSTIGRVRIKPELNVEMSDLKYYDTLKDIDFLKYEKKIWIDDNFKGPFFENLKRDAHFLNSHGVMDYSLAIYVINRESLTKFLDSQDSLENSSVLRSFTRWTTATGDSIQEILEKQKELEYKSNAQDMTQDLRSIKSTKENLYYHIGIIDYLIVYDCKKAMETFGKKLSACNPNLDISGVSPGYYAQRFVKFVESILF